VQQNIGEEREKARELTPDEKRLCSELGIDTDSFLGERFDQFEVVRRDPYFLLVPRPLNPGEPVVGQLEALELQRNNRFGNHMTALANAYLIAKALHIPVVSIPSHPLLRKEFLIDDVRFYQKGEKLADIESLVRLRGRYFYRHTLGHLLAKSNPPIVVFPLFTKALHVVPKLRVNELCEWVSMRFAELVKRFKRDLTIHIRSGDIFSSDRPHPNYWQPPLSFYLTIINRVKPGQVTLVFEDRGNPVIHKIEEHLTQTGIKYRVMDGPIEEVIREILTARNLIVARGSFSKPIVAVGVNLRALYIYPSTQGYDALSKLAISKFVTHVVHDDDRAYEVKVNPWRNSAAQREAMLTH